MKKNRILSRSQTPALFCAVGLIASLIGTMTSSAAPKTWDGDATPDGRWSTGANWDLDTAPVAGDQLFFAGAVNTATTNDLAANRVFQSIVFSTTAGAFTLRGNSIVLSNCFGNATAQDIGGGITNFSATAPKSFLNLTLTGGKHIFNNTNANQLFVGGAFTRGTGAVVQVITGPGAVINASNFTLVNGIIGGWVNLNRTNWATLDFLKNVVPYTSYTDVAAGGTIASGGANNIRFSSHGANDTLAAAGTTDINTLMVPIGNVGQTLDIGAGKTLRLGTLGGISRGTNTQSTSLSIGVALTPGTLTAGGGANTSGEIVFDAGGAGNTQNTIIINSQIADNGSGKTRLIKTGLAAIQITGSTSNNYSGGTYIAQGRVQLANSNSAGTGPIKVFSGGQAFLGTLLYTNDWFLSGVGTTESAGLGAIRLGGGATILGGTITLDGDSRIAGGATNTPGILAGKITGPGGIELGITGTAIGQSGIQLNNSGNDWAGNTAIIARTGGTSGPTRVILGAKNAIPGGPGKGNLTIGFTGVTVSASELDLNGFDESINGLFSAGAGTRDFIYNSSLTKHVTLTVGNNDQGGNYAGFIQDTRPIFGGGSSLSLTKVGAGVQILSGVNTYTGPTEIDGGTLMLSGSGSINNTAAISIGPNGIMDATGRGDTTLTLTSGQVLAGTGKVRGDVLEVAGSTISPGSSSVGTLTCSNTVYLQGQTLIELDAVSGTCDMIVSPGTIFYGGELKVVVVNGSPAPNQSFKLFDAPVLSGLFNNTNFAALDPGLVWSTNLLTTDGTIQVVQVGKTVPRIASIVRTGTNLIVKGINGTNNQTYYVLTSTNITLARSAWTRVATNHFDGTGKFIFTNGINPTRPRSFYILQVP